MTQPLMDTLQVANELEQAELERTQAQGVAHTLNTALSQNVAARKDVDAGFDGIRKDMDLRFGAVDARFVELRTEMDVRFVELEAKMDVRFTAVETKIDALAEQIKFGATMFGIAMALVVGMMAATWGMIAVLHAGEPAAPTPVAAAPPVIVYASPWPNGASPAVAGPPASVSAAPTTEESPRRP